MRPRPDVLAAMTKNIGIDFDNTIVTYDEVFYRYALRLGLINDGAKRGKKAVRDMIRILPEGNDRWTELQGLVYGKYMEEAEPMQGVENFLDTCRRSSFKVYIVSHKTVYPAMGPRIDLQAAAKKWLKDRDFLSRFNLTDSDVMFEETLQGKLDQISRKRCSYFIDDLAEVLGHPGFPEGVRKMLYGRQESRDIPEDVINLKSWNDITEYFFG